MKVDTLFLSNSDILYAGTESSPGKFSGRQVRNGRLYGASRTGVSGIAIARVVGGGTQVPDGDPLPRELEVTPEGNPAGKMSLGLLLESGFGQ